MTTRTNADAQQITILGVGQSSAGLVEAMRAALPPERHQEVFAVTGLKSWANNKLFAELARRPKRASKGWRRHVRRTKAASA